MKLVPGEQINFERETVFSLDEVSDQAISDRYARGEVRIITDQGRTQLAELPTVIASGRWELQPDFQRRTRWSEEKQSRLIESFIMNVPIPPIFLYEYEYSKYQVMDGLQRLTALSNFYNDELRLCGLEYWPELQGRTYSELPLQIRQGIDRRYISSIVLLYETATNEAQAARLKELVFERINSGGEPLTAQESRNALSRGPLNEYLPELARTPSFCRAWGIPEPGEQEASTGEPSPDVLRNQRFRKMEDVEMVLRFFALRQRYHEGAPQNLKNLLDAYWREGNANLESVVIHEIGKIFVATSDLVEQVLGEKAFWIRRDRNGSRIWVPRPTLLAYDSIMAAFSEYLDRADVLVERSELVHKKLEDLYDDNAEAFDGRKTDPKDTQRRDQLIKDLLSEVTG